MKSRAFIVAGMALICMTLGTSIAHAGKDFSLIALCGSGLENLKSAWGRISRGGQSALRPNSLEHPGVPGASYLPVRTPLAVQATLLVARFSHHSPSECTGDEIGVLNEFLIEFKRDPAADTGLAQLAFESLGLLIRRSELQMLEMAVPLEAQIASVFVKAAEMLSRSSDPQLGEILRTFMFDSGGRREVWLGLNLGLFEIHQPIVMDAAIALLSPALRPIHHEDIHFGVFNNAFAVYLTRVASSHEAADRTSLPEVALFAYLRSAIASLDQQTFLSHCIDALETFDAEIIYSGVRVHSSHEVLRHLIHELSDANTKHNAGAILFRAFPNSQVAQTLFRQI